jgi:hypothetical protein
MYVNLLKDIVSIHRRVRGFVKELGFEKATSLSLLFGEKQLPGGQKR